MQRGVLVLLALLTLWLLALWLQALWLLALWLPALWLLALWLIVCCFLGGGAGLLDQVPGICGCGAVASRDGGDCGATRAELELIVARAATRPARIICRGRNPPTRVDTCLSAKPGGAAASRDGCDCRVTLDGAGTHGCQGCDAARPHHLPGYNPTNACRYVSQWCAD